MLIRINAAVLLVAALFAVTGCQGQVIRPTAEAPAGGRVAPANSLPAVDSATGRKRQVRQADLLLAAGKTDEAIDVLRQVVTTDPDDPDAWNLLTVAFQRNQSAPAAVVAGRRALKLAPENMTVHYNLGMAMLLNGQPADALEHLERAAKAGTGPDALLALARAYQHMAGTHTGQPAEWLSKASAMLDRLEKEWPEYGQGKALRPYVLPDLDGDGQPDHVVMLGYQLMVTSAGGKTLLAYQVPTSVLDARWAVLDLGAPRPTLAVYWQQPTPTATIFDYSAAEGTLLKVGVVTGKHLTLGYHLHQVSSCAQPCQQPNTFSYENGAWGWSLPSAQH